MVDQPATRADLYRVAAFLRELDRMLHLATTRPAGDYRLPPAVLPPLPPTGSGGGGPSARQGGSGWMTTRAAQSPAAPIPPDIRWVEPPAEPEALAAPEPTRTAPPPVPLTVSSTVRDVATGSVAEPRTRPAGPDTAGPEPSSAPSPAIAPAPDPTPQRQRPRDATQSGTPTTPRLATAAPLTETVPPPNIGPPEPATDVAAGQPPRPALPMLPADERRVAEAEVSPRSPRAPTRRPPSPSTSEPERSAAPIGTVPEGAAPPAPLASPPPEPVDLVVEGIDAVPPPPAAEPAETTLDAPDYLLLDGDVGTPGPPPLPGGRGPRRTPAHLPAAAADRVQADLQRKYLDRTLRRSR